jgi:hypothetical protein
VLTDHDGCVRYVGKTVSPRSRFSRHHATRAWLALCLIIEWVPPNERWQEREKFWIAYYRRWYDLENQSPGGEDWIIATPEIRAKISNALKGRPKSREHRRKLALAHIGMKASEETRGRQFETIARNKAAAIAKIYYVRRANNNPISKPLRPIDHCVGDCVIIF